MTPERLRECRERHGPAAHLPDSPPCCGCDLLAERDALAVSLASLREAVEVMPRTLAAVWGIEENPHTHAWGYAKGPIERALTASADPAATGARLAEAVLEERARCIAALERKVRRMREPGGYIGTPTECKNDCDVLRAAIHVLYAIDPAQRVEVCALVEAADRAARERGER
jgi:hypothetical protein